MVADARISPSMLEHDLVDSRARSSLITADFEGERLLGPRLAIVNPPLWEIGHVGWFQEYWCLRVQPDGTRSDSMLEGADRLYDSAKVHHDTRWDLPLPDIAATRKYADEVLERVRERLAREPQNESLRYFVRLATFHEDMHAEAFLYTHQTLGYGNPGFDVRFRAFSRGDVEIPGEKTSIGAKQNGAFVFDNEKWAHEVEVKPFRIARGPVTNAEFLAFVEDGGKAPRYWKKEGGRWLARRFDRWAPPEPEEPVIHVDWNEARAWCAWAKRRLPTEAERELAAASGKIENAGGVWEWTATDFGPYPGFEADPYKEYSEPWFGNHKVLRGGSFAAPARLLRNTFRNFYMPQRGDVFCGFRTCALE